MSYLEYIFSCEVELSLQNINKGLTLAEFWSESWQLFSPQTELSLW